MDKVTQATPLRFALLSVVAGAIAIGSLQYRTALFGNYHIGFRIGNEPFRNTSGAHAKYHIPLSGALEKFCRHNEALDVAQKGTRYKYMGH